MRRFYLNFFYFFARYGKRKYVAIARSLRRLSSMIDLSPKFKVPGLQRSCARVYQHQRRRRKERGREECRAGVEVPPLRVLQWRWDRAIAFLPLPRCVAAFETRRSHSADEAPFYDDPPPRFSRKGAICRCHCSALGEGHYSEQGEPVTSAPTPAIDPTPVGRTWGCNAPDVRCRVLR